MAMSRKIKIALVIGAAVLGFLSVVAIVALPALFVVVNVIEKTDEARVARVQVDFKTLETAMNMFHSDHERWPKSVEELLDGPVDPLTKDPTQYITEIPKDPWTDQPYRSIERRGRLILISYGADMTRGGEGVNADIWSRR